MTIGVLQLELRIGDAMLRAGKGKEAIASFEKGFSLGPGVAGTDRALRMLLTLYLGEGDRRGVSSVEERIVARLGRCLWRLPRLAFVVSHEPDR